MEDKKPMSIIRKTIREIIEKKDIESNMFYIPDYQRGYRWGEKQAAELLDDIDAFRRRISQKAEEEEIDLQKITEIYCIQPLVVKYGKSKPGYYDVIDGQQRLTTTFILLKCLGYEDHYSIEYQTRLESAVFLNEKLDDSKAAEDNVDFYCMNVVNKRIKKWITENLKDKGDKEAFLSVLLDRVTFIWCDIDSEEPKDVFTRLNVNNIPLTSSELIKALFLSRSNYTDCKDYETLKIQQGQVALRWDSIEYALQNDEFWYFIHGVAYSKPTRIEYLLELIYKFDKFGIRKSAKSEDEQLGEDEQFGNDEYKLFRYFYKYFIDCKKKKLVNSDWLNEVWKGIKDYYLILEDWFNDPLIYHYIGYLLVVDERENGKEDGNRIEVLLSKWLESDNDREKFLAYLKDEIKNSLNKKWIKQIRTTKFNGDSPRYSMRECWNLLLFHNIHTIIMQNEKLIEDTKYGLPNFTKFPFHLFKKQAHQKRGWEIEHIRPDAGSGFKSENDIRVYLGYSKVILNDLGDLIKKDQKQKYIDMIERLQKEKEIKSDDNTLEEIKSFMEELGDDTLTDDLRNMLWNYVLLDGGTNSEYLNKIFPIKRLFIQMKEQGIKPREIKWDTTNNEIDMNEDKEIAFIPPCVKNVFTKSYSEAPSTMMNWTKKDAEGYRENIIEMLKCYGIQQEDNPN